MYRVSSEFLKEINKPTRTFKAKLYIRGHMFDNEIISKMTLTETVNTSEDLTLGTVSASRLNLILINPPKDIKYGSAEILPYIGLKIPSGEYEYIPLGIFNVETTKWVGNNLYITCYDNMFKLDRIYFSDLQYPAKLSDIGKEIAEKAGVELISELPAFLVDRELKGLKLREAISYVASASGGFCKFNRDGKLEIKFYSSEKYKIINYSEPPTVAKSPIVIRGLHTGTDENEIQFGMGMTIEFENPLINYEVAETVFNKLNGFTYTPFSMTWQGNPALQAGDSVTCLDKSGNSFDSIITEQKIIYNGTLISEVVGVGATEAISEFNANGNVGQTIQRFTVEQAAIKELLVKKADIDSLTAINANIFHLQSEFAEIDTLLAGNITALNIKAGSIGATQLSAGAITAGSGIIAQGAIGDAQISSLSASKLSAGIIDAAVITVKNLNADNITVGYINGQRVQSGTITNLQVAETAGISTTKILQGTERLDIVISGMNSSITSAGNKITSVETSVSVLQGQIVLKVNNSTYQQDVATINGNISTLSTNLSRANNDISSVQGQITSTNQHMSSAESSIAILQNQIILKVDSATYQSKISTIDGSISTINTKLNETTSDISIVKGQITAKIWKQDIESAVVRGQNLIKKSGYFKDLSGWFNTNQNIISLSAENKELVIRKIEDELILVGSAFGVKYRLSGSINGLKTGNIETAKTTPTYIYFPLTKELLPNMQYTVSINAKASINLSNLQICLYPSSNKNIFNLGRLNAGEYTILHATITTTASAGYLNIISKSIPKNCVLSIAWIKLEEGCEATEWQPSLTELSDRISVSETSIDLMHGEINLKVSEQKFEQEQKLEQATDEFLNSLSATKSQIDIEQAQKLEQTAREFRTSLNVATSEIDIKLDSISSIVSQNKIIADQNSTTINTKVNSLEQTLEGTISKVSSQEISISGINTSMSNSMNELSATMNNNINVANTNANSRMDSISTTINSKINMLEQTLSGTISTVSSQSVTISGLDTRFSEQTTKITQLDNKISSEVSDIKNGYATKGELALTSSELSVSFNQAINGYTPNALSNGRTVINASGITIYNGALTVKNNNGQDTLKSDIAGNLQIIGTFKTGSTGTYTNIDNTGAQFYKDNNVIVRIATAGSAGVITIDLIGNYA